MHYKAKMLIRKANQTVEGTMASAWSIFVVYRHKKQQTDICLAGFVCTYQAFSKRNCNIERDYNNALQNIMWPNRHVIPRRIY